MGACGGDLYGGGGEGGATEEIIRVLKDDESRKGWIKRLQERRREGDR